jgi:hypothetical protein
MKNTLSRVVASISYEDFLVGNGMAFLSFPFVCMASVFCFWNEELKVAGVLAAYALTHLVVLWHGLARFGRAKRMKIPSLCAAVLIFLFNRHTVGRPDHSPFSDGIGTVDQRVVGATGYMRIFDKPFKEYDRVYFDWTAFFVGLEMLAFAIFAFGIIPSSYDCFIAAIRKRRSVSSPSQ